MFRYLAEPRITLAEPLGSTEPRLKNTALNVSILFNSCYMSCFEVEKLCISSYSNHIHVTVEPT